MLMGEFLLKWRDLSGDDIYALICTFVGFLLIIIVPIWALCGGIRNFGGRALRRCFDGVSLHQRPEPGDVSVVYHTYRGLLVWVLQDEHRIHATPADAQLLLRRLLRYNLTWGIISRAMIYIPFLAIGNYLAQRRAIQRQIRNTGTGP